ncbi:hypothetical protein LCGC14_1064250 [marine sediment metagenome]|uniref:Uncharacterized protein n=2 Tax=root TaxID=1 RepID=A0A831QUC4_9FLAO|nr:hypothetical protein [Pricia sp.]HEA22761.1 hypothetical protein [Pricia antarctica]
MEFTEFIQELEKLQTDEIEIQTVIYTTESAYVEIIGESGKSEVEFQIPMDYWFVLAKVKTTIEEMKASNNLDNFMEGLDIEKPRTEKTEDILF